MREILKFFQVSNSLPSHLEIFPSPIGVLRETLWETAPHQRLQLETTRIFSECHSFPSSETPHERDPKIFYVPFISPSETPMWETPKFFQVPKLP
jgi:hypothetical protein